MSVGLDHPEVERFLARLDVAAAELPPGRREELLAEIREHLADALTASGAGAGEGGAARDAAVRQALDRLGDPADIVAAETDGGPAGPSGSAGAGGTPVPPPLPPAPAPAWGGAAPAPVAPASPWGPVEIGAVLLLTVGMVIAPVGPLVGLVLAWVSPRWVRREKVVASVLTLLPLVLVVGATLFLLAARTTTGVDGDPATPVVVSPTVVTAPAAVTP